VVPFEKIFMSVDTTSTGIFDVNFVDYNRTTFKTQFVDTREEMTYTNVMVNKFKNKLTIKVQTPSVIPRKYIDVIVRPLF